MAPKSFHEQVARPICSQAEHEAMKSSLPAFATAVGGEVKLWAERPGHGLLLVVGNCPCRSTIGMHVTDADWERFVGRPVPAHVQPFEGDEVANVA